MARRKAPTVSNAAYAAEVIPLAATTIVSTYVHGLQPLSRIAQSSVGETHWSVVVAAVAAVRVARESTALIERNLLGLAALSGAPLGEVAALLGIAPSTLAAQLDGTDASLLGQTLIRAETGQWAVA